MFTVMEYKHVELIKDHTDLKKLRVVAKTL